MDKLLRLGWWHRREACQPLELSHPFEFDFEGRCTRAKIILTIERKERKEGRNQSRCSTEQFVFLSLSHSLSPTILFFTFLSLLSKKLFLFSFFRACYNIPYRFRWEIWEKSKRGIVVKRRMKNLLSLLKSNKRSQATRQSFYPSPPLQL